MNLEFNFNEEDFFKAIGITEEDENTYAVFISRYYQEISEKFQSKKKEETLNDYQLKKFALSLSSYSKMLQTGLEWFKDHKRKDQLTVLLLADIFARMSKPKPSKKDFLKQKGRLVS